MSDPTLTVETSYLPYESEAENRAYWHGVRDAACSAADAGRPPISHIYFTVCGYAMPCALVGLVSLAVMVIRGVGCHGH